MRALRVALGTEQGERRRDRGQGPDRDESRADAAPLLSAKAVRKEQSHTGAESGASGNDETEFGKRQVDSLLLLHDGTSRTDGLGSRQSRPTLDKQVFRQDEERRLT